MKVITEENLIKVINSLCEQNEGINGISELLLALEEIDTSTVSKLRPMFFDGGSRVSEEAETIYNDGHKGNRLLVQTWVTTWKLFAKSGGEE